MPVTTLAARLPEIETVRRWSQSLALLDAILSPERSDRYFTFDAHWGDAEQMASMQNGSGDDYSIVFASQGACLWGFDHESEMSPFAHAPPMVWPGVVDEVPTEFQRFLADAPTSDGDVTPVTTCLWRLTSDTKWQHGPVTLPTSKGDPDGADWLFAELDGRAETYRSYALDYFEKEIDLSPILHVYEHKPLTDKVVSTLNPETSLSDLTDDLHDIDYPDVGE
jgi:hypothetical protein